MAIEVFHSSRFEPLWELFQQQVHRPLAQPLAPERIVVPSSGWESYFSRRLASADGCWAHCEFHTLGAWIHRVLSDLLGRNRVAARDPDAITWKIAACLPGLLDDEAFQPVARYLQADGPGDSRRRIELARHIANLFDQYLIYRPELIASWRSGQDVPEGETISSAHAAWQRKLFLTIEQDGAIPSLQELIAELDSVIDTVSLPERVSVWVTGMVPLVHYEFLDLIQRGMQVLLYVVGPAPLYWGNGEQREACFLRMLDGGRLTLRSYCAEAGLDPPHPLIESFGKLAIERQQILSSGKRQQWVRRYSESESDLEPGTTLLEKLQRDLRRGRQPESAIGDLDDSITIHSCHSAIREVEVLRDQLRRAFESDPDLQPEDVVVCCPDLETYGPLVDAVFGLSGPTDPGYMPYAVVGRSPRRTRAIVDAYCQLLETMPGRFEASRVLDLLNLDAIQSAAGLDDDQVATVAGWVADSGICWAVDSEHRHDEGLPASDLNTWQFGFDRLLMGYAMPPGGGQLAANVLALDRAEGLEGEVLGRLVAWVERVRQWREQIEQLRPLREWRPVFLGLIDDFLDCQTDEAGTQRIRGAIDALARMAADAGFDEAVPFSVAAAELVREVDQVAGGRPFQLGGIAFCEMTAMRSLPFKVVALLGLNDGVFPRTDRPVGFDLMGHHPRPGDRSLRLEDKSLMLEALLAARQRLIITFQGQNLRDHRQRPPSVVVEELLETIAMMCGGESCSEFVTRHPLQPFSPRYFDRQSPELFSYEARQQQAAAALIGRREDAPAFFLTPLPEVEELHEIRLRDLQRLLNRPWELFLERLGIRLPESPEAASDREPQVLNKLEEWQIGDQWLQNRLAGSQTDPMTRRLLRSGRLPAGPLGRQTLQTIAVKADRVASAAMAAGVGVEAAQVPVRVAVGPLLIVGHLDGLTPEGLRRATYSSIDKSRVPRLWLDHLLATVLRGDPAGETRLFGRAKDGKPLTLRPVSLEVAMTELENLLRWYRLALRVPLPFFSKAVPKSMELLGKQEVTIQDGIYTGDLIAQARKTCEYSYSGTAELDRPSARIAFAGLDPFAMQCSQVPGLEQYPDGNLFAYLIESICVPILDYLE